MKDIADIIEKAWAKAWQDTLFSEVVKTPAVQEARQAALVDGMGRRLCEGQDGFAPVLSSVTVKQSAVDPVRIDVHGQLEFHIHESIDLATLLSLGGSSARQEEKG